MQRSMNDYAEWYQKQLQNDELHIAYEGLIKYLMALTFFCEKKYGEQYRFGSVLPGYLDYSYFSFYNVFLRERKLRFGIVLNHKEMRFDLWLMGQNANIQKEYWELLKSSEWNMGVAKMPKYSVLEAVLLEKPDFSDKQILSAKIATAAIELAGKIETHIRQL